MRSPSVAFSSGWNETSQYRLTSSRCPRAAIPIRAGSSFATPSTMLWADGVARNVNRWPAASQLIDRGISLSCRIGFSSEEKSSVPFRSQ
jgi:hypothetical protein